MSPPPTPPAPHPRYYLSFQSKVLLPILGIMVVLMLTTAWIVDQRITRQMESEAEARLRSAEAVFENSHRLRVRHAEERYRNVTHEPRYRATFQTGDPGNIRDLLRDLIGEFEAAFVAYLSDAGEPVAALARDLAIPLTALPTAAEAAIANAINQQLVHVDTIILGDRLFELTSVPVLLGADLLGVLLVGNEVSEAVAREVQGLTSSEIVFIARDQVVASTLGSSILDSELLLLWKLAHASPAAEGTGRRGTDPGSAGRILLNNEHYLWRAGHFESLDAGSRIGYLLLFSYERSRAALRVVEDTLFWVRLVSMALASFIIWILIRRVTHPLRLLRSAADAVGRGDFSQRVHLESRDECGELASAFNQMTANLQGSRAQLEKTVETLSSTRARLTQSEKLSAIGEFVAGVAHELNNPLTVVIGSAQLAQMTVKEPEERENLEMIVFSAMRCHRIVQSLLSFSRQRPPERQPVHLRTVVDGSVDILGYHLRTANVATTIDVPHDLPLVLGDAHQLQQVMVNLINNARQAIEGHRRDGRLVITGTFQHQRVSLEFRDNGPGISPENLARIFTPFFTTKEVGKGTGLGLSLSYGIIQEHGGTITVHSTPGEGTQFVIELPAITTPIPADPATAAAPDPDHPMPRQRLLIVDDEEDILTLARNALQRDGHTVDIAPNGDAALQKIRAGSYDLILCDIKMPGLGGEQVYERLRTENPTAAARFLFMTGDLIGDRTRQLLADGGLPILPKPFTLESLRQAVARAIRAGD